MSKRDWGAYAPLGVILAVAAILVGAGLQNHSTKTQAAYQAAQEQNAGRLQSLPSITIDGVVQQTPIGHPNPKRDEWREEEDLKAQRDMAHWALWMFIATSTGVAVTLAGVIYVKRTLDLNRKLLEATAKGADAAYKAYVAEHRAWLKVTPLEAGVTFHDDGKPRVQISFRAENIGRSPAIDVYFGAAPYQARRFLVTRHGLDRLMEEERRMYDVPGIMRIVLIPGDFAEHGFSADAETHPHTETLIAEQIARGVPSVDDAPVSISVAVVVFYKSTVSEDLCHTAHVFWLRKKDDGHFDPALGAVPPEQILIRPLAMESRIA